jgi:carbon storage regulator
MLVLSRRVGEQIHIGRSIVVTVVRVGPQDVRLGIEAPHDVKIMRSELIEPEFSSGAQFQRSRECYKAGEWAAF